MITLLGPETPFPPATQALQQPNGLLAAGADLSPARLLNAYRQGIFPWFSEGEPVLWWCPDPRMVLYPAEFQPGRSLRKVLRNRDYLVQVDHDFAATIRACAAPRAGAPGTWISRHMIAAYEALHALGHAHSVETWMDGQLVGGLYGVAVDGVFFGESMFSLVTDASKIAFAHLVAQLRLSGFGLLDCQMHTGHLERLGARQIPRQLFLAELKRLCAQPRAPGRWTLAADAARDLPWQD
ncbi:MAG: leucyl/phenylalanyl-tRNA--protein transferase [Pseudomonadota bacterium]|nr:leucyl/phenylalanyl-tRNA--protein transferase [Pseudomonadota bacterium]